MLLFCSYTSQFGAEMYEFFSKTMVTDGVSVLALIFLFLLLFCRILHIEQVAVLSSGVSNPGEVLVCWTPSWYLAWTVIINRLSNVPHRNHEMVLNTSTLSGAGEQRKQTALLITVQFSLGFKLFGKCSIWYFYRSFYLFFFRWLKIIFLSWWWVFSLKNILTRFWKWFDLL